MICDKWLHIYGNKLGTGVNCEWVDDVRENVRGEWLQHTIDGNVWSIDKDTCSVCKETFYQISETGCVWNYCPNCGADMRHHS